MLSKHIREEFLAQINIAIQHMEEGWYESRVHHLEARYTLFVSCHNRRVNGSILCSRHE